MKKRTYQQGNRKSTKKKTALTTGGRISRREEVMEKSKKTHTSRIANEEIKKVLELYGINCGKKLFETKLYECESYENHYRMSWEFFGKIDRWKLMVILLDNLYDNGNPIPLMDPRDMILLMQYKRGEITEIMTEKILVDGIKNNIIL